MFVNDNYGSRWVKSLLSWIKHKTKDGCDYNQLLRDATLQGGLKRSKTIELINEYIESEFIRFEDGKIFWCDNSISPEPIKEPKLETPPKDKKRKHKSEEKEPESMLEENIENEEIKKEQREKYKDYLEECRDNNKTPISYSEWLVDNYGKKIKGVEVK